VFSFLKFCTQFFTVFLFFFVMKVPQASNITTFSGYPGVVASVDDYYVLNSGLIVTETTNGVMNASLYAKLTDTKVVLSFLRAVVSNKMANNGSTWVETFARYNSGTYNNQWMVIDTNKFQQGQQLQPGALYILEQIPGYTESADVTDRLALGYWPSYNVPYFPYIYEVSGFAYYAQKYGAFFSYQSNPRAEIFRRDSYKVDSVEAMQRIMRYNDYPHDPLSHDIACYAISSRYDLLPSGNQSNPLLDRSAAGGIDSKITTATLARDMTSYIQGGPTHDDLPPFEWKSFKNIAHFGMPDKWDFSWVMVQYDASGFTNVSQLN